MIATHDLDRGLRNAGVGCLLPRLDGVQRMPDQDTGRSTNAAGKELTSGYGHPVALERPHSRTDASEFVARR